MRDFQSADDVPLPKCCQDKSLVPRRNPTFVALEQAAERERGASVARLPAKRESRASVAGLPAKRARVAPLPTVVPAVVPAVVSEVVPEAVPEVAATLDETLLTFPPIDFHAPPPVQSMAAILFQGPQSPLKSTQHALWADLYDILASMTEVARKGDSKVLDAVLATWFPQDDQLDLEGIHEGKRIFVDDFCKRFNLYTADARLSTTSVKIMELWDRTISLLISGDAKHYLKESLEDTVSVLWCDKSSKVAPLFVMPVLMCLSMGFNATEEKQSSRHETFLSISKHSLSKQQSCNDSCILDGDDYPSPHEENMDVSLSRLSPYGYTNCS
jgi:hypothetical protein